MRHCFKIRAVAVTAPSIILAVALLSGAAKAVTDTVFKYSTAQTGSVMIPASAFAPESGTTVAWSGYGGSYKTASTTELVCFIAPVNLPQGADMTALGAWYSLTDTGVVFYTLFRVHMQDGAGDTIVYVNQPPSSQGNYASKSNKITDTTLQHVDNRRYQYGMYLCVDNGGYFFGARLDYTYTSAGD